MPFEVKTSFSSKRDMKYSMAHLLLYPSSQQNMTLCGDLRIEFSFINIELLTKNGGAFISNCSQMPGISSSKQYVHAILNLLLIETRLLFVDVMNIPLILHLFFVPIVFGFCLLVWDFVNSWRWDKRIGR
uniref:Uncharacterized protein n=1 Tax=Strigamia maritima TaxID=126957 RepID=T1JBZ5_STRMM